MEAYVLAEFENGEALLEAARKLRESGTGDLDLHSPYPLHGADEALGLTPSKIPMIALGGGLCGAIGGYAMQWYLNSVDWPIDVGGRPPHAPPSFIPVTFELGILLAALSIFFGLFALCRLPQPYHPAFEAESFRSAATHGFWLSAKAQTLDERTRIEASLKQLGAAQTLQVAEEG